MSGVARVTGTAADALAAARARATTVAHVDGPSDRASLLDALADALAFPSWSGRNLDALEELVRDLSWLPRGPVELVWSDAALRDADPRTHAAVLDILDGAAVGSAGTDRPLRVVLVG